MKFEIVLADPPWNESGGGKIKRGADMHYKLMKTKDIIALGPRLMPYIADDAFLFLWVTNRYLQAGLDTLSAWGFSYRTNFVWVKDRIGLGFYARGQHELCLLGVRGSPARSQRGGGGGSNGFDIYPSVLNAPRGIHSKKPEAFYKIIESYKTHADSLCLELFARDVRANWSSWGNELEKSDLII